MSGYDHIESFYMPREMVIHEIVKLLRSKFDEDYPESLLEALRRQVEKQEAKPEPQKYDWTVDSCSDYIAKTIRPRAIVDWMMRFQEAMQKKTKWQTKLANRKPRKKQE